MQKSNIITLFFLIVAGMFFTSCREDKNYTITSNSEYITDKNTKIDIKQLNNELHIKFEYSAGKDFPFPHNFKGDTLHSTAFCFEFYKDGKQVVLTSQFSNTDQWNDRLNLQTMSFEGPVTNIARRKYVYNIQLPMYAFYSVPEGLQNMTMKVYQKDFFPDIVKDSTVNRNQKVEKKVIWLDVDFSLQVPVIYQTEIRTAGFQINVSQGSDFSLVGKGNADLYWEAYYPDFSHKYFISPTETNTKDYIGAYNFTLFHYNREDILCIAAYDFDLFSKDDMEGSWNVKISDLETLNNDYKLLPPSGNTSWFKIKGDYKGKN